MSRSALSEQVNRLLPGEKWKRVREAILQSATYSGQRLDTLRRNIDQENRLKDGKLQDGTLEFPISTTAELDLFVWVINYQIFQPGFTSLPVLAHDPDFPRPDVFTGDGTGTIKYYPGTIDSEGNGQFPDIPEGEVILREVIRNTDGSNDSTPGNGNGNGKYVSLNDTGTQVVKSYLGSEPLAGSLRDSIYPDANGVFRKTREDYHGVYSTVEGVGATDWSKIVTINVAVGQLRYFVMLEFAGVSPSMEKGMVWIQFETDGAGDLTVNKLKVFGEINPAKLKMVKLDAITYAVFVHHNESGSFFKFRPQFSFGGSTVYTYHHQDGRDDIPVGTQYEFELHGDLTDVLDSIATLESDLTDLESNILAIETEVDDHEDRITALETDPGEGTDENAVHYDSTDGKTASEKAQARDNIGVNGSPTILSFSSNSNHNLARPTNYFEIAGNNRSMTGFVAGSPGEIVFIASTANTLYFSQESTNSSELNRFSFGMALSQGYGVLIQYNSSLQRWIRLSGVFQYEVDSLYLKLGDVGIQVLDNPRLIWYATARNAGNQNQGYAFSLRSNVTKAVGAATALITHFDSDFAVLYRLRASGAVDHQRSQSSEQSIRRDEQALWYRINITTAGAIEDQVSTFGIFNYRYTSATSLGGVDGGEIGRKMLVQNDNSVDLTIVDESASSISANRFALGEDLTIAPSGKALFIYTDALRWELVTEGGSGGGGGADTNAVHYNADDSKTASEKTQARANIGSKAMPAQIVNSAGQIDNLAKTSNFISFTGGGDKTITGIANFDPGSGEEVVIFNATGTLTILGENGGSDAENRFQSQTTGTKLSAYSFITIKRGSAAGSAERWQVESLNRYIPEYGVYRKYNTLYLRGEGGASLLVLENSAGSQVGKFDQGGLVLNMGLNVTSNGIYFKASTGGATIAFFRNSAGSDMIQVRSDRLLCNYTVEHARSNSAVKSIRRDEQRIYYLTSVTTSGSIADQALTDGIFNYRFTAATDISGFGNGEIGRTIDIDNDSGSNLTLLHENAGSIAANRIYLIGTADLVIPTKGKVTLKYCTGSRWELVSKNF